MSLPHGGHLARHQGVVLRQVVRRRPLRRRQGHRGHRLRPGRAARPRAPPKVILAGGSAIPRLIDFARFRAIADEVGAIFWVDAAHFIGLVAGQAIPSPVPFADVVSFTTHKVLRGPRSGAIVCREEHAKAIDKAVFPMMQGGPQMHTIAAKAVNFKECATPEYAAYTRQVVANAKVLAEGLGERGIRPTTGGTDTHLSLHDLQPVMVTGVDAEARCDAAGITLNKNAIPFDPRSPTSRPASASGRPASRRRGWARTRCGSSPTSSRSGRR